MTQGRRTMLLYHRRRCPSTARQRRPSTSPGVPSLLADNAPQPPVPISGLPPPCSIRPSSGPVSVRRHRSSAPLLVNAAAAHRHQPPDSVAPLGSHPSRFSFLSWFVYLFGIF